MGTAVNDRARYLGPLTPNASDFYRFTLATASQIDVVVSGIAASALLLSGDTIANSIWYGGSITPLGTNLNAGTYYLEIRSRSDLSSWYDFSFQSQTLPSWVSASLRRDTAAGGNNMDGMTSDPTLLGQVSADRTITKLTAGLGNTPVASFVDITALLDSNGRFLLTPSQLQQINQGTALSDGSYTLRLQVQDIYNKLSPLASVSFVLDTQTFAPSHLQLVNRVGQTNLTRRSTPTITGNAEVGAIVQILSNGRVLGQATTDVTGVWQAQLSALVDGTYTLSATATDGAGNVRSPSPLFSLTVDTTTPTPTGLRLLSRSDSGSSDTDGVTNIRTPIATGSAEAGATVRLYNDTQLLGQGIAGANRTWEVQLSTLTDGTYNLSAIATDGAGNVSAASALLPIRIDTQAPLAPSNLSLTPVGTTAVRVSGSAEANTSVQLWAGTTLIAETIADSSGTWRITTGQLRNGNHTLTAMATDGAGNVSPRSSATSVTVTSLVPSPPQNLRLTAATDSGTSSSDNITRNPMPVVTGTAEAGATVRLFREQQLLGETIANATGTWSIALPTALPQGAVELRVVARNSNGEGLAATLAVTIDGLAPTSQIQLLAAGSSNAVPLVNGTTLRTGARLTGTVNGTGSAVVALRLKLGSLEEVSVPVADNGLFLHSLNLGGFSGTQPLLVTLEDQAGNTTALTYTVTLDTTGTSVSSAPVLVAQLLNNTGDPNDEWTFMPGVAGVVSSPTFITGLRATFDGSTNAIFQDISSLLTPDGTFTLGESDLEALTPAGLVDGNYTLRLQMITGNNTITERSLSFRLDRTAPALNLPELVDGIGWEVGTRLKGTVQDNLSEVETSYQIQRVRDGQAVPGQTVAATTAATTGMNFDQVLSELPTLEWEEVYDELLSNVVYEEELSNVLTDY